MVSVTIRDLDQAGTLLDQVVQVGANRVYGIRFGVADPTELLTQARDQAVLMRVCGRGNWLRAAATTWATFW